MISYLKDDRGYIYAYIEYHVLDSECRMKRGGDYGYIQDIWIHPLLRVTGVNPDEPVLRELISKADEYFSKTNVKWIYWRNNKHKRVTKSFKKDRLSKMGVKVCN